MASCNLFGWELIYKCVEKDLAKKDDVIIAFVHWYLIKNGFRCVGMGDSKELIGNEVQTESLPDGWNRETDFSLRYVYEGKLYLLRASRTSGHMIINFLRSSDLSVSSCMLMVDEVVHGLTGPLGTILPGYETVIGVLQHDLLDPVFQKIRPSAGTQTEPRPKSHSSTSVPRAQPYPVPHPHPGGSSYHDLRDPRNVGRADLDPFATGPGGGMIFDPFNPLSTPAVPDFRGGRPGLPRGAVPPGARFDPIFGPGGPRVPQGPTPDHLPPPGYDDMFM